MNQLGLLCVGDVGKLWEEGNLDFNSEEEK